MPVDGITANTRVALYIRVSTEEQAEEGWSIAAQERVLRTYCQTKGWQVVMVYKDEGRTGTNTNRPGFQDMLRDAHDHKFDVIAVHKLDRFSRNLIDVLLKLKEFEQLGVTFVSTTEANMDLTTPMGRFQLAFMGFIAEWYVENLRAETTKGKKERFEQGMYNGDLRYGYSQDEIGRPIPNKDAAGVVMAYELCAQEKTDSEIAILLNRAGYRTYRLIANAKRKTSPDTDPKLRRLWTKDSVCALLRAGQFYLGNTEYLGEGERRKRSDAIYRGDHYQMQAEIKHDTHPAIITHDLYNQVVTARSKRVNPGRSIARHDPKVYLLGGGLACCSICGHPLRSTGSKCGKRYLYYQCSAAARGHQCNASRKQIREEYLVPQIDDMVHRLELPEDWRELTISMVANSDQEQDDSAQRRQQLESRMKRLTLEHREGFIDDADYTQEARQIKLDLARIVVPVKDTAIEAGEMLITMRSSWLKASKVQRRDILRLMLAAAYVDTDNRTVLSVQPHVDFIPLFRQTGFVELNGRFIL